MEEPKKLFRKEVKLGIKLTFTDFSDFNYTANDGTRYKHQLTADVFYEQRLTGEKQRLGSLLFQLNPKKGLHINFFEPLKTLEFSRKLKLLRKAREYKEKGEKIPLERLLLLDPSKQRRRGVATAVMDNLIKHAKKEWNVTHIRVGYPISDEFLGFLKNYGFKEEFGEYWEKEI